jgi:hypothetical protein
MDGFVSIQTTQNADLNPGIYLWYRLLHDHFLGIGLKFV